MTLDRWAEKWNVPKEAIKDLREAWGDRSNPDTDFPGYSEAGVLSRVRLEASQKGYRLWRNNVGATYTDKGHFLRYGLANDSSKMNRQIKSADLIGIRPVIIRPDMVGWTIGQFVSREIKTPGWRYKATDREQAQLRWAELIMSLGGDAAFAVGEGTL